MQTGVGKTCLAHRLVDDDYRPHFDNTEFLYWSCGDTTVEVWDIESMKAQYSTDAQKNDYYKMASLFLSCYDRTKPNCLKEGLRIFEVPCNYSKPAILVACKKDKFPAAISSEVGGLYAAQQRTKFELMEVSSETGEGIQELRELIAQILIPPADSSGEEDSADDDRKQPDVHNEEEKQGLLGKLFGFGGKKKKKRDPRRV
eukprot:TRINITY_DN3060_c0_g2_i4.p1 TRINITY_DN3060_c0_g2~~TRINITY_DN3060_c0_g2_i4.p1  ORF type:complete len:201 (-),score=40.68 TRINITY_DN3060_c0_g2_i4:362-964(-)